ncbi:hypothetical protein Btru_026201 [Bulinus truncatus]|nr:hypothetical protein Btru_026201 [Bulinus truncatus]
MGLFINQGILVTASKSKDNKYSYNTVTVVLLTEVLKLVAAAILFIKDHSIRNLFEDIIKHRKEIRHDVSNAHSMTATPGSFIDYLDIHLLFIMFQVFSSCFAGVYNEYLLKDTGAEVHIMMANVFMYMNSIICNVLVLAYRGEFIQAFYIDSVKSILQPNVVAIIINNAAIGIVTSLFLRSLNSILKTFASALELMFTAVLCWMIFGIPVDLYTVLAIFIVSAATYLYAQNPVSALESGCRGPLLRKEFKNTLLLVQSSKASFLSNDYGDKKDQPLRFFQCLFFFVSRTDSPQYTAAIASQRYRRLSVPPRQQRPETRTCYTCGRPGHIARHCHATSQTQHTNTVPQSYTGWRDNHTSRHRSPPSPLQARRNESRSRPTTRLNTPVTAVLSPRGKLIFFPALVNNCVAELLRDTGAVNIVVRKSLVLPTQFLPFEEEITLADGSQKLFPTAQINIDTPFISGSVMATVMDNPVADIILGNLPDIQDCTKEQILHWINKKGIYRKPCPNVNREIQEIPSTQPDQHVEEQVKKDITKLNSIKESHTVTVNKPPIIQDRIESVPVKDTKPVHTVNERPFVLVCYSCRRLGHTCKTCPKRLSNILCFNCHLRGHVARHCPSNSRKQVYPDRNSIYQDRKQIHLDRSSIHANKSMTFQNPWKTIPDRHDYHRAQCYQNPHDRQSHGVERCKVRFGHQTQYGRNCGRVRNMRPAVSNEYFDWVEETRLIN